MYVQKTPVQHCPIIPGDIRRPSTRYDSLTTIIRQKLVSVGQQTWHRVDGPLLDETVEETDLLSLVSELNSLQFYSPRIQCAANLNVFSIIKSVESFTQGLTLEEGESIQIVQPELAVGAIQLSESTRNIAFSVTAREGEPIGDEDVSWTYIMSDSL